MAAAAEHEIAQGFERRPRVEDESLVFKYALAAAIAVPQDVLELDDRDAQEGRNQDTPYWRTKRYGHAEVRDHGDADELDLYERLHLQGTVKRLLGDRRFVEFARSQAAAQEQASEN